MKLKKPNEAPPGGFYYITSDQKRKSGASLRTLIVSVMDYYEANDIKIDDDLPQQIEDQICARIGEGFCWRELGDRVAGIIQVGARGVDKIFGTKLERKAQNCPRCGKRKRTLNRLVN